MALVAHTPPHRDGAGVERFPHSSLSSLCLQQLLLFAVTNRRSLCPLAFGSWMRLQDQPVLLLAGRVGPGPAREDGEAVARGGEKGEVDARPGQPGGKPAQ